ncbi:MAG: choline/carnitine O-acyltransferase [Actinomycetota bacterium]|nr:choline/carnitine O-acyltransferase [Actinomycetota bacterium]
MSDSEKFSSLTFGNEDNLPRVPLPTLEGSCERFLEWCRPLVDGDELQATEVAVASFLQADGPARTLQAALERYDADDGAPSWLQAFWLDRYLGRRHRTAINANFFFLFEDTGEGQVGRAAGLVAAAVDYKLMIDDQQLPPVFQRGRPVSMEQNKYLFSATRIPGPERDSVRTPYTEEWPGPSEEHHIVVFFRGNMFRLEVIGQDGRPYGCDSLAAGIQAILTAGDIPASPGTQVGHLTTKARADWAASRNTLLESHPHNVEMLDAVERALFCLCLEEAAPEGESEACDLLLHGDSGNRWFDKAISLIVFKDGRAGINAEHSTLDGTTVVSFSEAVLTSAAQLTAAPDGAEASPTPAFAPLDFVLDAALRSDVVAAAASFAAHAADTATAVLAVADFNSERAKQLGMSPDAFAQLAFQLAHKRAKGRLGATYESIAMRPYRHGRTEAMRVVTPEAAMFVAAMDDQESSMPDRAAAFRAAAAAHVARARQCQEGDAPEQHLWELQMIQKRHGAELGVTEPLDLYDSPGWLIMRDDHLSTSSLPSARIRYFGFGSTSSSCIGIGYALLPDRFDLYLSTPQAVSDQMSTFADKLTRAVHELEDLLATNP